MRPWKSSKARIAVIGAGVAGISCAQSLKEQGFQPTILEKSRGLGGRLASRRVGEEIAFDHGVQYIVARSAVFERVLEQAVGTGAAGRWRPGKLEGSRAETEDWFVGTPAMNALIKPIAQGLDIRRMTEVTAIEREGGIWRVDCATKARGEPFDVVVSTAPAPQTRKLFASEAVIADALDKVSIAPCWALMLTFEKALDVGFDLLRSDSDDLAWICRDSSKPRRRTAQDCWVVHAGPAWSQRHLERHGDEITETMIDMLRGALGGRLPEIETAFAHRWRYARTTAPLGRPYLCSDDRTLFVGGDWCLGARVECAFESGRAIADALSAALKD